MGRLDHAIAQMQEREEAAVEKEIEQMATKPDDVPADVWELIQDNGRLATQRLNSLLSSPRFARFKVADQAKLIALAQDRAYGKAKTNSAAIEAKRRSSAVDATAASLNELARKAALPEYRNSGNADEIEDAVVLDENPLIN